MNETSLSFNIEIFWLQLIIVMILTIIISYILKLKNALSYEKKISKYSIDPINSTSISLFDKIEDTYMKLIKKTSKILKKSIVLKKMSKKYQKYEDKNISFKKMDYISLKIYIFISLILITMLSNMFLLIGIQYYQLLMVFLLSYFSVDIFLYSKEKMRLKKIDEDMLKAIIIMNSAYKSGKTTMQAVEIVKNELNGPIGDEFKKMYIDISFGLSLDIVFERFSKRINSSDAKYISASLTILNKTGGDIIKVFSSIEKSFFNRRKLATELKMQTSSSTLMYKTLISMPILISGIIFLLNPSYYNPLFTNAVGIVILSLIVLIFILYVYFMRKTLRIKV